VPAAIEGPEDRSLVRKWPKPGECPPQRHAGGQTFRQVLAVGAGVEQCLRLRTRVVCAEHEESEQVEQLRAVDVKIRVSAPAKIRENAIIVGNVATQVLSRLARHTLATFAADYDSLLRLPAVPARTVVGECRLLSEWYGPYEGSSNLAGQAGGSGGLGAPDG
jgi:hypothetical protein